MTTPVQRPASNSESRKRAAEVSLDGNLARRLGEMVAALDATEPAPSYFVAGDAWGDPVIWSGTIGDPCPQPVAGIDGWRVQRDHPELWAVIVAAVEDGVR